MGGHILIVDDHRDTVDMLALILQSSGYEVKTATSVREAIESASRDLPALLLCDLSLPDGNGGDVAKQFPSVKSVALTGYSDDAHLEQTKEAGFIAHLVKPVDVDRLESLVKDLLSRPG